MAISPWPIHMGTGAYAFWAMAGENQDDTRIPAGRWGAPADPSGAAVFLASDAAAYVAGHILAVDGGRLARR